MVDMQILLAIVLIINGVFAFTVWPSFWKRIKADERSWDAEGNPTKFLTVHRTLIFSALALGAISAVVGVIGLFVS